MQLIRKGYKVAVLVSWRLEFLRDTDSYANMLG